MKVAIVILNYNGKQLLEQFLPSVTQFSQELATIYVIDNASTDDSVDFIKSKYPNISIICNKENHGFARGYNEGLQYIDEELLCLLNSDVEVTKDWLTPIISAFKNDSKLGIAQPKLLNQIHKNQFDYAGAAGGFIDKYGFPFCRGRIFSTIEQDQSQYNTIEDIFWASGACFFIKNELFKVLEGFDESFFAHMEEIDLCWRAKNKNISIKCFPESIVYHVGGATLNYGNPKKTYLNFRNSLRMLTKNLPSNKLFSTLFKRLILDGLAALQFLFKLKPLHTFSVLKAHFHFYWNMASLLKLRKGENKPSYYYREKSIVWSYFVNKKRTFNSL